MLVTYQAVPKEETTQTGVQYDIHIVELCIPLDSKTDATGPKNKSLFFISTLGFFSGCQHCVFMVPYFTRKHLTYGVIIIIIIYSFVTISFIVEFSEFCTDI